MENENIVNSLSHNQLAKKISTISAEIIGYFKLHSISAASVEDLHDHCELSAVLSHVKHSLHVSFSAVLQELSAKKPQSKNMKMLLKNLTKLLTMVSQYIRCTNVPQSLLFPFCSLAVKLYFIEETHATSCGVLITLCGKFGHCRLFAFNEIFEVMEGFSDVHKHLKMITKFSLMLVQSISLDGVSIDSIPDRQNIRALKKTVEEICISVQKYVGYWIQFISIVDCNKSKNEYENAGVFQLFVQHLMELTRRPEFPAAFVVLRTLLKMLAQVMSSSTSSMLLKKLAVQQVCFIVIRLRKLMSSVQNEHSIQIINKVLGRNETFFSPNLNNNTNGAETSKDIITLNRCLVQYLDACHNDAFTSPRYFHMMFVHCFLPSDHSKNLKLATGQKRKVNDSQTDGTDQLRISRILEAIKIEPKSKISNAEASVIHQYLLFSKTERDGWIDRYFDRIVLMAADRIIGVRSSVVKCFIPMVESKPDLLSSTCLKIAIRSLILDRSPLIRELTLSTLSKIIVLYHPSIYSELMNENFDFCLTRLLDINACVRRTAVNLLTNFCQRNREDERVPKVMLSMLNRIADEDESVESSTAEAFCHLWFLPDKLPLSTSKKIREILNLSNQNARDFELLMSKIMSLANPESTLNVRKYRKSLVGKMLKEVLNHLTSIESLSSNFDSVQFYYVVGKIWPQLLQENSDFVIQYLETCIQNLNLFKGANACVLQRVLVTLRIISVTLDEPLKNLYLENIRKSIQEQLSYLNMTLFIKVLPFYLYCVKESSNKKEPLELYTVTWGKLKPLATCASPTERLQIDKNIFTVGSLINTFGDCIPGLKENAIERLCVFICKIGQSNVTPTMLKTLSLVCHKHRDVWGRKDVQLLYLNALQFNCHLDVKTQVLRNVLKFLEQEEEIIFQRGRRDNEKANFGKLNESISSLGSETIIVNRYLPPSLELYLNPNLQLRRVITGLVVFLSQRTLVDPSSITAHLISMTTDVPPIKFEAEKSLKTIVNRYPSFIAGSLLIGVRLSYHLHVILSNSSAVRGCENTCNPSALLSSLYASLPAHTRQILIQNMLREFNNIDIPWTQLLFVADNIAHFPYQSLKELQFVVNKIDVFSRTIALISCLAERYGHLESSTNEDSPLVTEISLENCLKNHIHEIPTTWNDDWLMQSNICLLQLCLRKHLRQTGIYVHKGTKIKKLFEFYDTTQSLKTCRREAATCEAQYVTVLQQTYMKMQKLMNEEQAHSSWTHET